MSGGIYLLLGPDRPRKLQRIQAAERTLRIQLLDRHHLDAAAISSADLLALARQQPSVSVRRLITVEHAHKLRADAVEALQAQADVIAQTACLFLVTEAEVGAKQALAQLQASVTVERFAPPADASAAKPFALTDALGAHDAGAALAAVREQLSRGKEPLELVGLIAWQLNRWVTVKRLMQAGVSAPRISEVTGIRDWQVQRTQSEVANRPLSGLQRLLERCWQLDTDSKTGRMVPELAIEQLVLEACLDQPAA